VTGVAYTLGQAAKAADVSKTTIQRAIKSGRLSASRQDDGSYVIDPAELHRVFSSDGHADSEMASSVTPSGTGELRVEVEMLRERISEKDEAIDDLRHRLDQSEEERRQVQARLTALLTDQRPAAQPAAPRGLWRRLRGK
jgi:DNA-binding transcriptional MerR regulator